MSHLPEYTENLIQKLSDVLGAFRQQGNYPELTTVLERWEQQSAQMRTYAAAHDHVSIAFVGGTGAGKSTLINALLDADLLPTHSFKTCTSAAIEVAYASRKSWRAELTYLPLIAWEREKKLFLEEVHQAQESGHSTFTYQDFLYKAWSLYRPRKGLPPMPFPLDELLKLLHEPLPKTLEKQIQAGTYQIQAKSASELKAQLAQFLTAESPVWPLLQQVRIEGPVEILKGGLRLIDLPGLNDPNPVRERIAYKYLQEAEFIWLVFGAGRGLTREIVEVMKGQQFISQIVLDGKVSALSFIATRSDDYVPALEKQSLHLAENCSSEDIRLAREQHIRQQILQQLSELTLWFANRYKVSEQSQEVLKLIASTLQQSPIFLTSALNYLALSNWFYLDTLRFEKVEQTGILQARAFMQEIVAEHGVKARKKLIRSQFQQMNGEIRRLIEGVKYRQSLQQVSQQRATELQIQVHKIRQDQLRLLREIREELQQELKLKQIQFEKQMLYAFSDLRHRSAPLLAQWNELNWQYLARAVQYGGRYTSPSTGVQINLLRDLLQHIETELALDWYAFFQQRLLKEVDQARFLLSGLLEQSYSALVGCFTSEQHSSGAQQLMRLKKEGQGILDENSFRARHDIEQKIRSLQNILPEIFEDSLKVQFGPIFKTASDFTGKGLKQDILICLETALKQVLPQVAREIQDPLQNKLEELVLAIQNHHEALVDYFQESLDLMCQFPQGFGGDSRK